MINPGLIDRSMPTSNDRLNILGLGISLIDIKHGIMEIERAIIERSMMNNWVAAVSSDISSPHDPEVRRIFN